MSVRSGRVALAGVGGERAAAAAARLIDAGARALLSWGVAGALAPRLEPGDLLLPSKVVTARRSWFVDAAWREAILEGLGSAHGGNLWCSAVPVGDVAQKRDLADRGMVAVDMESAAVAAVAARRGLPFIAIKSICDPASRAVPAVATDLLGIDGRLHLATLARALRAGPRAWRELNRLRIDHAAACRSLRDAARTLPALGPRPAAPTRWPEPGCGQGQAGFGDVGRSAAQ
ncbi:MAG TPA: squalene--hopene cyclase [Caldimonas sp.]|nr:squalene--hopene cyclase [Caldimonas sp.]